MVDYNYNSTSYSLGLGRKFTDNWSGAVTLGYEDSHPGTTTNLGPVNGQKSVGLAATYTQDNIKITGGVRYIDFGNATTRPPVSGSFTGNDAVAVGLRVGFYF